MNLNENDIKDGFFKLNEKMKSITENLDIGLDKSFPILKKMADDYANAHKPKDKKVIKIDGNELVVSLLSDGKIILDFPTLLSSEKYFNSL